MSHLTKKSIYLLTGDVIAKTNDTLISTPMNFIGCPRTMNEVDVR